MENNLGEHINIIISGFSLKNFKMRFVTFKRIDKRIVSGRTNLIENTLLINGNSNLVTNNKIKRKTENFIL